MKKILILTICAALCLAALYGCSGTNADKPAESVTAAGTDLGEETVGYVLSSNSEKATMRADKDFKTVIQITNTYPDEIVCVFETEGIAVCEWAQWNGDKGALMFTGLKKGTTTLTVYAGVVNGDVSTAAASLTVAVTVEEEPGT